MKKEKVYLCDRMDDIIFSINLDKKITIIAVSIAVIITIITYNFVEIVMMWKTYPEEIYKQLETITVDKGEIVGDFWTFIENIEEKANIDKIEEKNNQIEVSYYLEISDDSGNPKIGDPKITVIFSKKGEVLLKKRDFNSIEEYFREYRIVNLVFSAIIGYVFGGFLFIIEKIVVFILKFISRINKKNSTTIYDKNRKNIKCSNKHLNQS